MDALLGEERKGKVSAENPVPDFKQALVVADEVEHIEDAAKQMGGIVRSLITDSFGDAKYAQATECLGVMREELINLEEPGYFNTFIRDLKKSLLSGALGGDRRDFWFKIRWSKLGLIDKNQSDVSDVTHEEAEDVRILVTIVVVQANKFNSFTSLDNVSPFFCGDWHCVQEPSRNVLLYLFEDCECEGEDNDSKSLAAGNQSQHLPACTCMYDRINANARCDTCLCFCFPQQNPAHKRTLLLSTWLAPTKTRACRSFNNSWESRSRFKKHRRTKMPQPTVMKPSAFRATMSITRQKTMANRKLLRIGTYHRQKNYRKYPT